MLHVWHCGHIFYGYEKENGNYSSFGYLICYILYIMRHRIKWCGYWFYQDWRIFGSFRKWSQFGFCCRDILRCVTSWCWDNTHVKCWRYLLVDTGIQRKAERAGKVKRYLPSAWCLCILRVMTIYYIRWEGIKAFFYRIRLATNLKNRIVRAILWRRKDKMQICESVK